MKRWRWLAAVVMMAVMILFIAACQEDPEQEEKPQTGQEEKEEKEEPSVLPQKRPSIAEQKEKLDEQEVLWYIKNERVEQNLQQELLAYKDDFLLWGSVFGENGPNTQIAILSKETGTVQKETELEGFSMADVMVCGDLIAITDWEDGKVHFLDESLQVIKEVKAEAQNCIVSVSPDATKIYAYTREGVIATDVQSGETTVLFEEAEDLFQNTYTDDVATIFYTDPDTDLTTWGMVDQKTATAQKLPFEGAFHGAYYSNDTWLAGVLDGAGTYYLGKGNRPYAIRLPEMAMISLISNPARILVTTYNDQGLTEMSLYELDGSFLSHCQVPIEGPGLTYEPVWSERDGGYYFTVTNPEGKDLLLFWDLSTPVAGEELQLEAVYEKQTQTGTAVSGELYERANQLSDQYGVEIYIAEQAEMQYRDFVTGQEYDETYIKAGLDTLEEALKKYPDGFMQQLLYGTQIKLQFHLVGSLELKEQEENVENGFTSFVGFVEELEGRTVVVIDIARPGALEDTIHHEIMHVIDNKLTFDANQREGAVYSDAGWEALNPEGFEYPDTKVNLPMSIYNEENESYFVDIYSRTTIREDRARIMEYAIAGYDWAFSKADGRFAKLEYLCRCIRDAFDTTGWPDATIWEKTMERCR